MVWFASSFFPFLFVTELARCHSLSRYQNTTARESGQSSSSCTTPLDDARRITSASRNSLLLPSVAAPVASFPISLEQTTSVEREQLSTFDGVASTAQISTQAGPSSPPLEAEASRLGGGTSERLHTRSCSTVDEALFSTQKHLISSPSLSLTVSSQGSLGDITSSSALLSSSPTTSYTIRKTTLESHVISLLKPESSIPVADTERLHTGSSSTLEYVSLTQKDPIPTPVWPFVASSQSCLHEVASSTANLIFPQIVSHPASESTRSRSVLSTLASRAARLTGHTPRSSIRSSSSVDDESQTTPSDDASPPTSTPKPSPTSPDLGSNDANPLPGWKILVCLMTLAANAALQRSGADELPCGYSVSFARLSPLICIADIIVLIITVIWCKVRPRLTFRAGVAVYLFNASFADTRQLSGPTRPLRGVGNVLNVIVCCLALLSACTIFFTHGLGWRLHFWTSVFFASPAVYLVLRALGRNTEDCEMARDHVGTDDGNIMLQIVDGVWCVGYVVQFAMWVQVVQEISALPKFRGEYSAEIMAVVISSICAAILVSVCSPKRMFKLWSVRNWSSTQVNYILMSAFVLALAMNMPDSDQSRWIWRQNLLMPLGAFSVVVLEIFIVTLGKDLVAWFDRAAAGDAPLDEPAEQEAPEVFQFRLNPMLNSTPDRWRSTLMVAFLLSQFTFAALYYGLVYDGSGTLTRMPAWLGRFF